MKVLLCTYLPTCRVDTLIARVNGKRCCSCCCCLVPPLAAAPCLALVGCYCCCCCHGLENAQNTFSLLAGKDSVELKSELSNDHFVPQAFPFCRTHPIGSLSNIVRLIRIQTGIPVWMNLLWLFLTVISSYFIPFCRAFCFKSTIKVCNKIKVCKVKDIYPSQILHVNSSKYWWFLLHGFPKYLVKSLQQKIYLHITL